MAKKIKGERAGGHKKEDSNLKKHQDKYNSDKKDYIRKFQSKFTQEDVMDLVKFFNITDEVFVLPDGIVKYPAFNQDDFKGQLGATALEVLATKSFARQFFVAYFMQMIEILLSPTEKIELPKESKPNFK